MKNDMKWRKSSRSGSNGGHCVEVANELDTIAIRDSKNPNGSLLLISHEEARALSKHLKNA